MHWYRKRETPLAWELSRSLLPQERNKKTKNKNELQFSRSFGKTNPNKHSQWVCVLGEGAGVERTSPPSPQNCSGIRKASALQDLFSQERVGTEQSGAQRKPRRAEGSAGRWPCPPAPAPVVCPGRWLLAPGLGAPDLSRCLLCPG